VGECHRRRFSLDPRPVHFEREFLLWIAERHQSLAIREAASHTTTARAPDGQVHRTKEQVSKLKAL
jgi:hypothetical protein